RQGRQNITTRRIGHGRCPSSRHDTRARMIPPRSARFRSSAAPGGAVGLMARYRWRRSFLACHRLPSFAPPARCPRSFIRAINAVESHEPSDKGAPCREPGNGHFITNQPTRHLSQPPTRNLSQPPSSNLIQPPTRNLSQPPTRAISLNCQRAQCPSTDNARSATNRQPTTRARSAPAFQVQFPNAARPIAATTS
ncbi:MAG: hypothetical protein QOK37_2311, partial [Thermoanaerobaculia bacterium]|nr:hypothetical protein [Thermoanaerobaculia bacterium]